MDTHTTIQTKFGRKQGVYFQGECPSDSNHQLLLLWQVGSIVRDFVDTVDKRGSDKVLLTDVSYGFDSRTIGVAGVPVKML